MQSHYRRPLPAAHIPFASPEGKSLFQEALHDGTAEGFFPLIEQFHTQADPAFCGLASLVMALNALGIDPGRLWRGPWRWFSEELLDCCTPLAKVQLTGISMEELACLARCNGAAAVVQRPGDDASAFRRAVQLAVGSHDIPRIVIASYSRRGLDQTGLGHFSPIGAYHAKTDSVLVLDVARFKYPPHWVKLTELYAAMHDTDPATGRSRGWIELERGMAPSSLRYFVSCREGLGIGETIEALLASTRVALRELAAPTASRVLALAAERAVASGLAEALLLRSPQTPDHERLFDHLRELLVATALHRTLTDAGVPSAELAAAWLLTAPAELWADLPPDVAAAVAELTARAALPAELVPELDHVQKQIQFVLDHARTNTPSELQPGARSPHPAAPSG